MRNSRSFTIPGLALSLGVVVMSLSLRAAAPATPQLTAQTSTTPQLTATVTTTQLTPQSAKLLDELYQATTAAMFQTWLQSARATTTLTGTQTIIKLPLSFLSTGTPPTTENPNTSYAGAGCVSVCPTIARGSYKTASGKIATYECTRLEGCSFDKFLKKWRCSYQVCSIIKPATVIPG